MKNGVFAHIVSDNYYYWQDGKATYHYRYSTYKFICGQAGDAWKAEVKEPGYEHLHETYAQRAAF